MRKCIVPECPYYANDERCYYHDKKKRGLFDDRLQLPRHHVRVAAVIDDEQRELADLLEVMGADAGAIRAAVMRAPSRARKPLKKVLRKSG